MSDTKKVMVIDRSGRGHALSDLFVRTNPSTEVLYVPGCAGIKDDRITSCPDVPLTDVAGIIALAKKQDISFAFVANTAALAEGYVDALGDAGIKVIGPDKQASKLETSKSYAKELCTKYGIPVAEYEIFKDPDEAKQYVQSVGHNVVVKADGLCGGNGSYVCSSPEEAAIAIDKIMVEKVHGDVGENIVIEKRLPGIELSFFALYDGNTFVSLPMALDYKRAEDGNMGVNGGGMGSFSPHPLEGPALDAKVRNEILEPLKNCIKQEGLNYNGIIYVGAMLSEGKLSVLEFNIRLGDPEAEVILPRIKSDFTAVCEALMDGNLDTVALEVSDDYCCNVVATQGRTRQISDGKNKGWYKGWPFGRYGRGYEISGIESVDENLCRIFIGEADVHPEKGLVSDGGRVIHVVGMADTKDKAIAAAYDNIDRVQFNGARHRNDIGVIYNDSEVLSEEEIRSHLDYQERLSETSNPKLAM